MAEDLAAHEALIARAWELCYLDPIGARELGRQCAAAGGAGTAEGWLHVALAEVRVGDLALALAALAQARQAYAADGAPARGLALCDEVQAIALRRSGDYAAADQLHARLDAAPAPERDAMHAFLAHNSRYVTAKLLGRVDDALRHLFAARDAAHRTGWAGPRIASLSNLGGYHLDLYNLEEARSVSEAAFDAAYEISAHQNVTITAANLIIIYHACGEFELASAKANFLLRHLKEHATSGLEPFALPLALGHLAAGDVDAAMDLLEAGAVAGGGGGDGDGMTMRAWLTVRCLLARGDWAGARAIGERTLQLRSEQGLSDVPYVTMSLLRTLTDAAELDGDAVAALRHSRAAQAVYEQLVGRGARARQVSLQITQQLTEAQRERDAAVSSRRAAEDAQHRLAELNAALRAQVAETEMLHAKLREQALRDPLTGLHNRRYLFEVAPGLLELARRQSSPLCVALLDLDHFKLFNDTFGHEAGDFVLQRFSTLLTQLLRRSDVICRHGGEEFVAVMPDIDADGAQLVLERLLEAFQAEQPEFGHRRLPRASFSAGIALFPRHGDTLEQLLARADSGLYAAKDHGRARIELAPHSGFGTQG